jgi:homoserine O-succinyltransferase/O-acetyltransferase
MMSPAVQAFLERRRDVGDRARPRAVLHIGLVNNMPDSALERTERQFFRLFADAAPDLPIRWHLFSLTGIRRAEAGHIHLIHQNYRGLSDLFNTHLDGVIVTGAEPLHTDLRQERYWPELATLFDWIEADGPFAIFSCLAAHAAVLHFDGIERRPLREKCFGLFDHEVSGGHPLTLSLRTQAKVAHSRWNEVRADALKDAGYQILTCSQEAGVDLFLRRARNLMLFLQGHPEYDAEVLGLEYRRDARRYLEGAADRYPELPKHYFEQSEIEALSRFRERALLCRDVSLMDEFPEAALSRLRALNGTESRSSVFTAWLASIAEAKIGRDGFIPERRFFASASMP